jgi:hypothetical protein
MTPDYASPEQVRGEPVTTATDVYSLGAVLYEPHHVETYSPKPIEEEICSHEPKRPSEIASHFDADLDNIILTVLRKETQRRYPSAEQFSEDIRLYLEGRPVRARKDTARYRAGKFLRRNRAGVALAALMLIGVITAVSAVKRQARRVEQRFGQVRKLANTVLFELNPEIENLAGSTTARELLVNNIAGIAGQSGSGGWRRPTKNRGCSRESGLPELRPPEGVPGELSQGAGHRRQVRDGLEGAGDCRPQPLQDRVRVQLGTGAFFGCRVKHAARGPGGRFDSGDNRSTCISCPRRSAWIPG